MDEGYISYLIYFLLFMAFVVLFGAFFLEPKQDETTQPQSKYMMDDYGNIYSVQPCQNCKSCFEFHKVDTAEIKVKAFDFVQR